MADNLKVMLIPMVVKAVENEVLTDGDVLRITRILISATDRKIAEISENIMIEEIGGNAQ